MPPPLLGLKRPVAGPVVSFRTMDSSHKALNSYPTPEINTVEKNLRDHIRSTVHFVNKS